MVTLFGIIEYQFLLTSSNAPYLKERVDVKIHF